VDLAEGYFWRQALIAMFLALLELVRLRAILLRQSELFGPIVVHKSKRFEEILSGLDARALEASLNETEMTGDP
jgi:chromatin segregation and condensation protein Rec8/ScpA/Scc1 (kleisin family)